MTTPPPARRLALLAGNRLCRWCGSRLRAVRRFDPARQPALGPVLLVCERCDRHGSDRAEAADA